MSNYRPSILIGTVTVVALFSFAAFGAKNEADGGEASMEEARKALPIAKIGDQVITLGQLETAADRQSPMIRKGFSDPEKRLEFLNKMISMNLLAAEAAKRGYSDHAEVNSVKKNQLASLMHKNITKSVAASDPGDSDLRKYYDDHIDNYRKPQKMRARHILIKDKATAQALLAKILKDKVSQYEFRKIAQNKSEDDATKARGGDLTFFSKVADRHDGDPDIDPAIVDAVFPLKENGNVYKNLIKSDKGYHIVMRTGRRQAMNLSFEDAKDRISLLVKRETRKDQTEESIDALMKKFKVTLHEENLKDVVIDLSGDMAKPDALGKKLKSRTHKKASAIKKPTLKK